mmetsp:Transcript_62032/g.173137  ORF Transcript_62032/g.173137 Transcript_62032/m.173137 type:complete len:211 (+) Transcript_62032:767-1399(+)
MVFSAVAMASKTSGSGISSRPFKKGSSAITASCNNSSAFSVFSNERRSIICNLTCSDWPRSFMWNSSSFFFETSPRSCICVKSALTVPLAFCILWSTNFIAFAKLFITGTRAASAALIRSSLLFGSAKTPITFSTSASTDPNFVVTSVKIFFASSFCSKSFRTRRYGASFFPASLSRSCREENSAMATLRAAGANCRAVFVSCATCFRAA